MPMDGLRMRKWIGSEALRKVPNSAPID